MANERTNYNTKTVQTAKFRASHNFWKRIENESQEITRQDDGLAVPRITPIVVPKPYLTSPEVAAWTPIKHQNQNSGETETGPLSGQQLITGLETVNELQKWVTIIFVISFVIAFFLLYSLR